MCVYFWCRDIYFPFDVSYQSVVYPNIYVLHTLSVSTSLEQAGGQFSSLDIDIRGDQKNMPVSFTNTYNRCPCLRFLVSEFRVNICGKTQLKYGVMFQRVEMDFRLWIMFKKIQFLKALLWNIDIILKVKLFEIKLRFWKSASI